MLCEWSSEQDLPPTDVSSRDVGQVATVLPTLGKIFLLDLPKKIRRTEKKYSAH
jgi:hypothetical protein